MRIDDRLEKFLDAVRPIPTSPADIEAPHDHIPGAVAKARTFLEGQRSK
jgi:hypothetical protein